MKKAQKILILTITVLALILLCSCNAKSEAMMGDAAGGDMLEGAAGGANGGNKNEYGNEYFEPGLSPELSADSLLGISESTTDTIRENPFVKTEVENVSTFSADVDTASYTYLRKLISQGYTLDQIKAMARSQVIRTEEIVNYFDYNYVNAAEGETFGTKATISRAPWSEDTYLLTLGIKAKEVEEKKANNLVFLVDVSGSMSSEDKLPLLKKTFSYLVDQLNENDTVSIVTYAGGETVALEGATGAQKELIMSAMNGLVASGSTNGQAGIQRAYQIAEAYLKPDGNNRIIIASDGDLNVGISDPEQLETFIATKRKSGVFLSVLGFGTGNFRDDTMSALAQAGNGVYSYIDSEAEAERIFTTSLLSTIYTVAKDVKFQLTFDPDYISEYRLIGYENRLLENEDFNDDTKDAGEVGSGHTLTVCYELKLTDGALNTTDESGTDNDAFDEWMKLAIRYKEPDSEVSELREIALGEEHLTSEPDGDFRFVSTLIEFSMILTQSQFRNQETTISDLLVKFEGLATDGKRIELVELVTSLAAMN